MAVFFILNLPYPYIQGLFKDFKEFSRFSPKFKDCTNHKNVQCLTVFLPSLYLTAFPSIHVAKLPCNNNNNNNNNNRSESDLQYNRYKLNSQLTCSH